MPTIVNVLSTPVPGLREILPERRLDQRGSFVKFFRREDFEHHGLATAFSEEFYTLSRAGVVRGLHFQTPPHDQVKLVTCVHGEVLDAVLDLRVGSPAFGRHHLFRLSAERGSLVYIPAGLAHGFCVLSAEAILLYKVTSPYAPAHDTGILWNSAGIPWPTDSPCLSDRDAGFVPLRDFHSPFRFEISRG